MNGLDKDFGDFGDDGIDLSSIDTSGASSAVSAASNVANAAASVDPSNLNPSDALNAGLSVLSTTGGATAGAALMAQTIQNGDWAGAGQQAFSLIKSAAVDTGGSALSYGEAMAAKGAAIGGTIGTVFPIIGNVIGAVVGAILGFVAGVGAAITGNLLPPPLANTVAQQMRDAYNAFRTHISDWRNGSSKVNIKGPLRDWYFKNFPDNYKMNQGAGPLPSMDDMLKGLFNKSTTPLDLQPALDSLMSGGLAVDYALWLAARPDGVKILAAAVPELQASILPLMPMAVATTIYITYVPILAAPGCYSPLAVNAVRQAAIAQGTKAGPQVTQVLDSSLPNDDLSLLLHAFSFLDISGNTGILTKNQQLSAGQSLYSPNREVRLTLQHDGNLVLYNGVTDDSSPFWSTGTAGSGASNAIMQSDGNFVLYGPNKNVIWASGTNGKTNASLVLQNDHNLLIADTNGKAVWATNTSTFNSNDDTVLGYVVQRSGIWDRNGSIAKGIITIISQLLALKTKNYSGAISTLNNTNRSNALNILPNEISMLADSTKALTHNWTKPYTVTDCLKGQSQAQIDQKIGLTKALGGVTQIKNATHGAPLPINRHPAPSKKTNLTNHWWWIEAIVASLVGIVTYNVVHNKKVK